ncbi:hypothetical protein ACM01_23435 [Streptomyces viridochromogenes]|uniref:SUKH-4 immunity protein n=1 Tax=Streptomyces viridochromogenes TaxID=1938 RepID=A0A0J7ZA04_STRVR|nr:SUKH-4 family immunity protein [Streptomyces viridochromogenes]KMS72302.1 hypothetical protein ACM01_23435 [Streptomyces viridochromogenes]
MAVENGESELIVPDGFFAYRALDAAERVSTETGRSLIRFGVIGRATSVFWDEGSGVVLSGLDSDQVTVVNASIGQFRDCVTRLADLMPFYSEDSDHEEWEAAARRVQEVICEVDAEAYREGAFWYEFRWDVSMGDAAGVVDE